MIISGGVAPCGCRLLDYKAGSKTRQLAPCSLKCANYQTSLKIYAGNGVKVDTVGRNS